MTEPDGTGMNRKHEPDASRLEPGPELILFSYWWSTTRQLQLPLTLEVTYLISFLSRDFRARCALVKDFRLPGPVAVDARINACTA